MRFRRFCLPALLLLWAALVAGCGDEEVAPDPALATPPAPEVFESPRLFLHVGQAGQVYSTLGHSVRGGEIVAACELGMEPSAAQAACLAKFQRRLQEALDAIEPPESGDPEPLTVHVIAAPNADWKHVLWVIMSADRDGQKTRRLDLRLPQDQGGSPIQSTCVRPGDSRRTRIEVGHLTGLSPTRIDPITVRVEAVGPFVLSAEGVQHPGPFGRLRDELKRQRTEGEEHTAATITTPPPTAGGGATPYIDVLRVVRICRELGYEDIGFQDIARPSSK